MCRSCNVVRARKWAKANPERAAENYRRRRHKNSAPRVYVVSNPAWPGFVKIGLTTVNPTQRLFAGQTWDPMRAYKFEALIEVANAEEAEAKLHAVLDPFRAGGEWFRVSVEVAVALAQTLAVSKPIH